MFQQKRKVKKIWLYTCLIVMPFFFMNRTWKYIIPMREDSKLIYILQWTDSNSEPLKEMGVGQQGFIDRNCTYTNCFVTSNKSLLGDITEFDVIIFNGKQVKNFKDENLPQNRLPHQRYVFLSIESAAQYPIVRKLFDHFFNWTWTYRLDSDMVWGYITITDMQGNIIGPNSTMHWIRREEMLPVSEELRNRLKQKAKTVAWIVSKCNTMNRRSQLVNALDKVLRRKYNISIDIYGMCGMLDCEDCDGMIKKDYLFYLAFENSLSEDYVTEKLSRALENAALPIVYGGANYNRFLPRGSYLDITEYNIFTMAKKIYQLVSDFEQYVEYFKWTNHYRYHRKNDTNLTSNNFCEMCAFLNKESGVEKHSVYRKFAIWWNEWEYPSIELMKLMNETAW